MWTQVDGKWWPQFRSSTTQTKILNRTGCTYLEAIRLKVAILQTPVHSVRRVVLQSPGQHKRLCNCPQYFAIPTLSLAWGSSEIETRLRTYDLRELVHPAATQHQTILSPQIPVFTIHAGVESPSVTSHYTTPAITRYRKLKTGSNFDALYLSEDLT